MSLSLSRTDPCFVMNRVPIKAVSRISVYNRLFMREPYVSEIASERYRNDSRNFNKVDTMHPIAHQSFDQMLKFGTKWKFLVDIKPDVRYVNHV